MRTEPMKASMKCLLDQYGEVDESCLLKMPEGKAKIPRGSSIVTKNETQKWSSPVTQNIMAHIAPRQQSITKNREILANLKTPDDNFTISLCFPFPHSPQDDEQRRPCFPPAPGCHFVWRQTQHTLHSKTLSSLTIASFDW